jgi:DNA replication protein DnaC
MTEERTLQDTIDAIIAKVQQGPAVTEELDQLNKARAMVWLSDLRSMIRSDFGKRCLEWNPARCQNLPVMKAALRNCVNGNGIIIQGPIGTGKTTLAVHMLLSLAYRDALAMQKAGHGLPDPEEFALAIRSTDLFRALSSKYGDAKDRGDRLMARAKTVRYLFIDDVGREAEDAESFAAFQSIVDTRYQEERAMIVATNMDASEWAPATTDATGQVITPGGPKAHWAAIISRWQEAASWIILGGGDLRIGGKA